MYVQQLKNFEYSAQDGAILKSAEKNRVLDEEEPGMFRVDKAKFCNTDGLMISQAMKKAI
ncbi:MAG: hypothetical protein ACPHY8_04750 [Patescibacteria group bacterium]